MEELLRFITSSLLPEKELAIEKNNEGDNVEVYIIKTKPEDAGILIGKNGKVIKAISQILKIKATLLKKKVVVKVVPNN
jgi:predicted RNA-binding protein YlqC (UPF0109 family)